MSRFVLVTEMVLPWGMRSRVMVRGKVETEEEVVDEMEEETVSVTVKLREKSSTLPG